MLLWELAAIPGSSGVSSRQIWPGPRPDGVRGWPFQPGKLPESCRCSACRPRGVRESLGVVPVTDTWWPDLVKAGVRATWFLWDRWAVSPGETLIAGCEEPGDERLPHLAGRAGNQDPLHVCHNQKL